MHKSLKFTVAIVASCLASLALAADGANSMRGSDVAAPDQAPEVKAYAGKRPGTEAPVARTFSTQPPVIPHAVEAPKIGDSHFLDREGKKHAEATGGRYNCVQCHVPQVDAPPLVDNTFKGDAVKKPVRKN